MYGKITASVLNVHDQPSADARIIGKLARNATVAITAEKGDWYEIEYDGGSGFVSAKYLKKTTGRSGFLYQDSELQQVELAPAKKIAVTGSAPQKLVAQIWNKYGNLMELLSKKIGIETGDAIAVFSVESHGDGFGADGKMIIRF